MLWICHRFFEGCKIELSAKVPVTLGMSILCEWQQQVGRLDLRNEGVYISAQAISNFCKDQFVIPCVHKAESLMGLLIYLGKRQARKQL